MNKGAFLLGFFALCLANPGLASSARELGQSELRQLAHLQDTISLKTALRSVSKSLQADVMEVRAFQVGGLYYRLIMKRHDGKLVSVIMDAQTGARIAGQSTLGLQITEMAQSGKNRAVVKAALAKSHGDLAETTFSYPRD